MKSLLVLLITLTLGINPILSQELPENFKRAVYHFNSGYVLSFDKIKTGLLTDNLIQYEDQYFYLQVINFEYFFNNNINVNFTFQKGKLANFENGQDVIIDHLENLYADEYFVFLDNTRKNNSKPQSSGNLYLGLGYTKRLKKISFTTNLQFGNTEINKHEPRGTLKKINANELLTFKYYTDSEFKPILNSTVLGAFRTEIHLSKVITFDILLQSYFFNSKFKFYEEIRNTYTEEVQLREFDYNKKIRVITFGLGVGFKL